MKILFSSKFSSQLDAQIQWYLQHRGMDFAITFENNIMTTVRQIAAMPTIGRREPWFKTETRSLLAHPGCRIYYRIKNECIYIAHLHFSPQTMQAW